MSRFSILLVALIMVCSSNHSLAEDVLQWRGSGRNGVYNETGLLEKWPAKGPALLWSTEEAGYGYSSPIVVKGRIYLTGNDDESEFVTCFDNKGKKLWRRVYSPVWDGSYPEARTTPTYVNGRIYMISGTGVVACVDANSGKLLWSVEVWARFK